MSFVFEARQSDSTFVDAIWRTTSERVVPFTSTAESRSEIVITNFQGTTNITVRGPETKATPAKCPAGAEFFGIILTLGTFMPHLPAKQLRDRQDATLPRATSQTFWLKGSAWQFPDFENADTFVDRLVHDELLVHEPIVDAVLQNQPQDLSLRTLQRRFLRATGLTYGLVDQITRARQAVDLLGQGVPILDTVEQIGYADQPHLTRSLKRFMGQTPAQLRGETESN